ncbi:MAG TPA: hypothetical protein VJ749_12375 [Pyrinomonadaceae bacterium]|nr:hypothetical protein [Pyrinomonadaceae bacterium]
MRFARLVFLIAGIYGLLALVPLYFMEQQTGRDYPPPITHPEYYYGFVGVAVAWQLAFLVMSRNPVRYRPLMPVAVIEKASFFIPAVVLYAQHRLSSFMLGAGTIDGLLGVLFVISYLKTKGGIHGKRFE